MPLLCQNPVPSDTPASFSYPVTGTNALLHPLRSYV